MRYYDFVKQARIKGWVSVKLLPYCEYWERNGKTLCVPYKDRISKLWFYKIK
jgi:hypothetical protein